MIRKVSAAALQHIETVCARWLPDGKKVSHEFEIGDRHGTPGKSLKVHLSGAEAGMWADFSTGDKGGDLVSLVAFIDGLSQGDAARRLAEFLALPVDAHATRPAPKAKPAAPESRPILPVPANAPPPPASQGDEYLPIELTRSDGKAGPFSINLVAQRQRRLSRGNRTFTSTIL
jgi:hypothetical protein